MCNNTNEAFAAFACSIAVTAETKAAKRWSDWNFSRMLWKTNYSKRILLWNQYSLWSRISRVEDNEVRSEGDGISKHAHVKLVNKQPGVFWLRQVLRCFRVVSSQFWTSSKFLLALETTTNNQEVKRSLYRLQNVNNLPKDYIRTCLTCRSLAELFNFIYRSCWTSRIHLLDFINISDNSRLINSNLLQRSKISVVADNEVRSKEDSISKQAHIKFVKKQLSDLRFHQVLRCFRVAWSQFWTASKCSLALETTTNNQEEKRSLNRLQNVNNIPKDYIRTNLTCRSLAKLFNFIGLVELQKYIYLNL